MDKPREMGRRPERPSERLPVPRIIPDHRMEAPEVRVLIERAQPYMSAEARKLAARLEQRPSEGLPLERALFQLPHSNKYIGDYLISKVRLPDAPADPPRPEIKQAYEQRSRDIQRLWQLVQPESYALLEKYQLALKLAGTLQHTEIHTSSTVRVFPKFSLLGVASYTEMDGQKSLLVDTHCSPAEAIGYATDFLRLLETYAQALETHNLETLAKSSVQERYQRTLYNVELNHILGSYGTPERYNPLQRRYREAYNQAIRDAYATRTIGNQTPAEVLRALGQQAGRKALLDVFQMKSPKEQLYTTRHPEKLFDERRTAERLGIASLEIGSSMFIDVVRTWAELQGSETSYQHWEWSLTEKKRFLAFPTSIVFPRSDGKLLFHGSPHPVISEGEPSSVSGRYILKVTLPSVSTESMKVTLVELDNFTGHTIASSESLKAHQAFLLKKLMQSGIDVQEVRITKADYHPLYKPAERRVAMLAKIAARMRETP